VVRGKKTGNRVTFSEATNEGVIGVPKLREVKRVIGKNDECSNPNFKSLNLES
jgi:hypothetical protein